MSLFKRGTAIKATTYVLTPLGRTKFDKPDLSETRYAIMSALREAPCTLNELERETHIERGRLNNILHEMHRDGYISRGGNIEL